MKEATAPELSLTVRGLGSNLDQEQGKNSTLSEGTISPAPACFGNVISGESGGGAAA